MVVGRWVQWSLSRWDAADITADRDEGTDLIRAVVYNEVHAGTCMIIQKIKRVISGQADNAPLAL